MPLEPLQCLGSLPRWRVARDDCALRPREAGNLLGDRAAMRHGRAEHEDAFAVLRQLYDLAAGGRYDCVLGHRPLDLLGDEFAGAYVQGVELGDVAPGLRRELREVSLVDQLLQPDLVADFVEDVVRLAYHPALEAVRGRRAADDPHLRVYLQKARYERPVHPVALRRDEVAFVDDAHLPGAEQLRLVVDRLDAADHHGAGCVAGVEPRRVYADLDVGRDEGYFLRVLLEKLLRAGHDEGASVPLLHRVGRDLPQDPALSGPDGHLDARVRLLPPKVVVDGPHGVFLVVSQSHVVSFSGPPIQAPQAAPPPAPRRLVRASRRAALLSASRRASSRRVQASRGAT